MARKTVVWLLAFVLGSAAGCYYKPKGKRSKAHPSYLSEAEAESLIGKRMASHGIKFITNMKLQREGAIFVADGYDRDVRAGFEYRSHEGMDFEDEEDVGPDGLTDAEIEALRARQDTFREYFLIVPEGPPEAVEEAVDAFIKLLYDKEVLKRQKIKKEDNLFPDEKKKTGDALPWEATGDLKKKREEMERKEKERKKPGAEDDEDAGWMGDDEDEGADGGLEKKPDPEKDEKPAPKKKEKKRGKMSDPAKTDNVWGEDDEDF